MADSDAVRSRRKRAHAAGDHHLCNHRHQPGIASPLPLFDPAGFDPNAELAALAGRLRDSHAADPGNALLARELRMTLQAMMGPSGALDAELTEFLSGFNDA